MPEFRVGADPTISVGSSDEFATSHKNHHGVVLSGARSLSVKLHESSIERSNHYMIFKNMICGRRQSGEVQELHIVQEEDCEQTSKFFESYAAGCSTCAAVSLMSSLLLGLQYHVFVCSTPRLHLSIEKPGRPLVAHRVSEYSIYPSLHACRIVDIWDCGLGVQIKGALAVDAQGYLRGLWAACCSTSGGKAKWVHQRVDDVHALASSGEFHAVVACVGSEVKMLRGVKDIVSLRLVRGQSLIYDNVGDPSKKSDLEAGVTSARRGEDRGSKELRGEGREGKMLTSAVLCGQYVVPTAVDEAGNGGKLVCGATQEPILYADSLNKPADMATAKRYLEPKIGKFFPALQGVEPLEVTAGVSNSAILCKQLDSSRCV